MTDEILRYGKSLRLVGVKIRFFYPLNQRLSAFHSSVFFYFTIVQYIFPNTSVLKFK